MEDAIKNIKILSRQLRELIENEKDKISTVYSKWGKIEGSLNREKADLFIVKYLQELIQNERALEHKERQIQRLFSNWKKFVEINYLNTEMQNTLLQFYQQLVSLENDKLKPGVLRINELSKKVKLLASKIITGQKTDKSQLVQLIHVLEEALYSWNTCDTKFSELLVQLERIIESYEANLGVINLQTDERELIKLRDIAVNISKNMGTKKQTAKSHGGYDIYTFTDKDKKLNIRYTLDTYVPNQVLSVEINGVTVLWLTWGHIHALRIKDYQIGHWQETILNMQKK